MTSSRVNSAQAEPPQLPTGSKEDSAGVSPAVRLAAAWAWRLIVIVAGVALVGWLLGHVTQVLIPVLLAALLAGLISPAVTWLRSKRVPAFGAAALVELGFIAVVLGLLTLAGQQIVVGFSKLQDSAMAGITALIGMVESLPINISTDQLNNLVEQAPNTLKENSGQIISGAVSISSTASTMLTGLFIMLFTLLFFLADGERIWLFMTRLVPRPARAPINGAGRRGWHSLVQYVRVQCFVAFIDALGIGLGAFLLGVPLAVPLGILVFLGSFIPLVGAIATGAIAILVALVANGPWVALAMLGVVLLVQQIEGNILQPLIMGSAVSLHPLAVFLAVAAGSVLAGIMGALFAVPLMAVLNTVVRYLAARQWEDDPEIAWQPYFFPWEIRRKARGKELTREEVHQQFRRFARNRRNEEAKARSKEEEKESTQREKASALEAAERVEEAEKRRAARVREQGHGPHHGSSQPRAVSAEGLEVQEAARMPDGQGRDYAGPEPTDRVMGPDGRPMGRRELVDGTELDDDAQDPRRG